MAAEFAMLKIGLYHNIRWSRCKARVFSALLRLAVIHIGESACRRKHAI